MRQLREMPEANRLTNTMTPAIIKVVDFAKSIPDFIKVSARFRCRALFRASIILLASSY